MKYRIIRFKNVGKDYPKISWQDYETREGAVKIYNEQLLKTDVICLYLICMEKNKVTEIAQFVRV